MTSFVLAGGCFWCLDSSYMQFKGVTDVEVGYMGGHIDNPGYEAVCDGNTGHAEVARVHFDETVIPAEVILDIFFTLHDPRQLNRQGNDVGTQYRSVIFYHNPWQQKQATELVSQLNQQQIFSAKLVTEISAASRFFPAESYHQGYFLHNPQQAYCQYVVAPKLAKFRQQYAALLK